jgi:hypothetical protein
MRVNSFAVMVLAACCAIGCGSESTSSSSESGADTCTPQCDGRTCGPDGCGGICGRCPSTMTCSAAGQCTPKLGNSGATCGACNPGETCNASGQCVPATCVPSCTGRSCGPDGCGGTCGTCPSGNGCDAFGRCAATSCTPTCSGRTCGSDGCGGTCGTCGVGQNCNTAGQCTAAACVPNCSGKTCGSDGCGGTCGQCPANATCTNGTSCSCDPGYVPDPTLTSCLPLGGACPAGLTETGTCVGDTWVRCDPQHGVTTMNCGPGACKMVSATEGACTCGNVTPKGVCYQGPSGTPNELHFTCLEGLNILAVDNCKALAGPGAFCSSFVSSFGTATSCFCSRCSPYDPLRRSCSPLSCGGTFGSCSYSADWNFHYCSGS